MPSEPTRPFGAELPPPAPASGVPSHQRFAEPRRLHPASVLLGIPVAQLVQAVVFPAAATFAAGGAFTVGLLALVGVVGLVFRVLAWQRQVFSFDGEVLRVDSGVLSRSHRSLDVARIQQVEIERGVVQRALGLAVLRVETAGSASEPEVDLRVLTEADAVALRDAVRASKARLQGRDATETGATGVAAAHPVITVPNRDVALAAVTGARLLVFPAVIGAGLQFAGQVIDTAIERFFERLVDRGVTSLQGELLGGPSWTTIALVVGVVLVLAVGSAVVVGLFRDGNYRVVRIGDDLHVSRGLVSTRDSVVPLRRVQLVEIQRNWLRRLLGYATVRIRSAGGSAGGDGRVTVPLVREDDLDRLLGELLPGVPGVPTLRAHPPAAARRALFRWLRPVAVLNLVVWGGPALVPLFDVPITAWIQGAAVAFVPLGLVLALVEYRQLAHGLTEQIVVSRRGALSITTSIAPVVKVQGVTSRRNPFQRRLGLTTTVAHVAGPGASIEVLDAGHEDAAVLHDRLTEHAARPTRLDLAPSADATSAAEEPDAVVSDASS